MRWTDDLGALMAGSFAIGMGLTLAVVPFADHRHGAEGWLLVAAFAWIALLPVGGGLALLGAFERPRAAIAARGGDAGQILASLALAHLALTGGATVLFGGTAAGSGLWGGLAIAAILIGIAVMFFLTAWGEPPPGVPVVDNGSTGEAMAALPRLRQPATTVGLVATALGLAVVGAAWGRSLSPWEAWVFVGVALVVWVGGGAWPAAVGRDRWAGVALAPLGLFAILAWGLAITESWAMLPLALGLSIPQARFAGAAAAIALRRHAARAADT